jgi:hypothetical protein
VVKKRRAEKILLTKWLGKEMINKMERCNAYQNTHVFFANSELFIKDYISYHT